MSTNEPVQLKRDVEAAVVPQGSRVTLMKGEAAYITQSLGGTYTVVVNGNMFRIDNKDADALGMQPEVEPARASSSGAPRTPEQLEEEVWRQLRNCYDPEIPVNIVDLGLIYDCRLEQTGEGQHRAEVRMTLTAPGCGMGPVLQQDVSNRLLSIEGIDEANVDLVWDPPWNQGMMTDAAKLQLGLY
jgi:probable FeS assembly SUF system protein SufT